MCSVHGYTMVMILPIVQTNALSSMWEYTLLRLKPANLQRTMDTRCSSHTPSTNYRLDSVRHAFVVAIEEAHCLWLLEILRQLFKLQSNNRQPGSKPVHIPGAQYLQPQPQKGIDRVWSCSHIRINKLASRPAVLCTWRRCRAARTASTIPCVRLICNIHFSLLDAAVIQAYAVFPGECVAHTYWSTMEGPFC